MKTETTQHPTGDWTLHELEPQKNGGQRWSVGVNGPRAYLTCDQETAELIAQAPALKAQRDELLAALENALNVLAGIATGDLATVRKDSPAIAQARAAIAKASGKDGGK